MRRLLPLGALAGLLVAAVVAVAAVTGGDDDLRVWVDLPDAAGLREGSQVKVGGVAVGTVDRLEVTARDTARARLRLESARTAIGRDAEVWVRPANLLGEKYVDLRPGDRRAPLADGATIAAERVKLPVEVDQILQVLGPATRDRLALLLREAGLALEGNGKDLARTVAALPPSAEDVDALFDEVTADTRRLESLLDRASRVVSAAAPAREDLARLVDRTARVLRTTGDRRAKLDATLAQAPSTLVALRATLRELDSTAAALRPAARGLERTGPALTETLDALPSFAAVADGAFDDLRESSPALLRVARDVGPLASRLRPTAHELRGASAESERVTASLDRAAPDLLGLVQAWTLAIQNRDGLGHLFRLTPGVSADMINVISDYLVSGATQRKAAPARKAPAPASVTPVPRPQRPAAGGEKAEKAPAATPRPVLPGPVGPIVDGLLDKLPTREASPASPDPDPASGLLDFLLG